MLATIGDRCKCETGVRNLERQPGKLTRKVATEVAKTNETTTVRCEEDDLVDYLGKPKVWKETSLLLSDGH